MVKSIVMPYVQNAVPICRVARKLFFNLIEEVKLGDYPPLEGILIRQFKFDHQTNLNTTWSKFGWEEYLDELIYQKK